MASDKIDISASYCWNVAVPSELASVRAGSSSDAWYACDCVSFIKTSGIGNYAYNCMIEHMVIPHLFTVDSN